MKLMIFAFKILLAEKCYRGCPYSRKTIIHMWLSCFIKHRLFRSSVCLWPGCFYFQITGFSTVSSEGNCQTYRDIGSSMTLSPFLICQILKCYVVSEGSFSMLYKVVVKPYTNQDFQLKQKQNTNNFGFYSENPKSHWQDYVRNSVSRNFTFLKVIIKHSVT